MRKIYFLALLILIAPAFSLSVYPSSFNISIYPGEKVTFKFMTDGAALIQTESSPEILCYFANTQFVEVVPPIFLGNVTIEVKRDSPAGIYNCNIIASVNVPDQVSSGSGKSGRSSSFTDKLLATGNYSLIPTNTTIKTTENGSVFVQKKSWSPYAEINEDETLIVINQPSIIEGSADQPNGTPLSDAARNESEKQKQIRPVQEAVLVVLFSAFLSLMYMIYAEKREFKKHIKGIDNV